MRRIKTKCSKFISSEKMGMLKKRTKNSWLSPNLYKNSSAIDHVARTPESEENSEEIKEDKLPKQKRIKKKRRPKQNADNYGKIQKKEKE